MKPNKPAPEIGAKPKLKVTSVGEIQRDVSAIQKEIAEAGGPKQFLKQRGVPVTDIVEGVELHDPTVPKMTARLETAGEASSSSFMRQIHGEMRNLKVHAGKQGKHIVGHNDYNVALSQGKTPGIFSGTTEEAQSLVDQFAGKGELVPKNPNSERVNFGKIIGKYVDVETGEMVDTTWGTIRYSKDGVYIVPSNTNSYYKE